MAGCTMLRLVLRPATEADGPPCADIFLAGRRRAFHWQPGEMFRLNDFYRCVEDEEVWVADVDGAVVGFVSVDRREGLVRNLFVDPEWQNLGIGSRLLNHARNCLASPAQLTCVIRNRAARAFYERNGWIEAARGTAIMGPYILYRKW